MQLSEVHSSRLKKVLAASNFRLGLTQWPYRIHSLARTATRSISFQSCIPSTAAAQLSRTYQFRNRQERATRYSTSEIFIIREARSLLSGIPRRAFFFCRIGKLKSTRGWRQVLIRSAPNTTPSRRWIQSVQSFVYVGGIALPFSSAFRFKNP